MLLIDTSVGPSTIEGMGVFTRKPVRAGTRVWTLNPMFDRLISEDDYQSAIKPVRDFIERYAYFDKGLGAYLLDGDHSRFLNHSDTASIHFGDDGDGYAIRDIAAGEELNCNYNDFMGESTISAHHQMAARPSATVVSFR